MSFEHGSFYTLYNPSHWHTIRFCGNLLALSHVILDSWLSKGEAQHDEDTTCDSH